MDGSIDSSFGIVGEFSHRLINLHAASIHLEFPIMSAPSRSAEAGRNTSDFSTFYFTPSLKLKLFSAGGIAPFVSAGGGLAHFSQTSISDNRAALQVGGGLDFKTPLPLMGLRVEVRDFMSGIPVTPAFTNVTSSHLHTLFAGAGITLHF